MEKLDLGNGLVKKAFVGCHKEAPLIRKSDSPLERYFSAAFRATQAEAVAAARAAVLRCDPVGYAACCQAVGGVNWLDRLKTITCPTLIVHGTRDSIIPFAMSERLKNAAGGKVTYMPIEGGDHNDLFDVGGSALFEAIAAFVDHP